MGFSPFIKIFKADSGGFLLFEVVGGNPQGFFSFRSNSVVHTVFCVIRGRWSEMAKKCVLFFVNDPITLFL